MDDSIPRPDFAFRDPPSAFEPGESVIRSGIYAVCHTDGSRGSNVFLEGERFPPCSCCGLEVRYELVRSAPYLFNDPDFSPDR